MSGLHTTVHNQEMTALVVGELSWRMHAHNSARAEGVPTGPKVAQTNEDDKQWTRTPDT